MSLPISLAVYFVLWFISLLVVLPFGVRTQDEAGEIVPGTPSSAPAAYRAKRVLALTTGVSIVAFTVVYALLGTSGGRALMAGLIDAAGVPR